MVVSLLLQVLTSRRSAVTLLGMPLDQDQFRAIISGKRRDIRARVARCPLAVAAVGYRLVVGVRNTLYDWRLLRVHRAGAPVLCVGNLTTGGTGKTPLVIWLARRLTQKGLRVAVLTRGYKSRRTEDGGRRVCTAHQKKVGIAHPTNGKNAGAEDGGQKTKDGALSDEPAELVSACPGLPVVVNPDRVAGAAEAIREHQAQVLLMDDGFQHRRLGRDLDIVAIDATVPLGYGRLLPAGLLREPVTGLRRAGAVVLTRCDLVSEYALAEIEARILQIHPDLPIARSRHVPVALHHANGSRHGLDELRGKRVFAFCGLGNPTSFLRTVEACGGKLVGSRTFNDHHAYTDRDLADVHSQARSLNAEFVVTSQKDWTKIARLTVPDAPPLLAYLVVELRFTAGGDSVTALIDTVLAGTIPSLSR
ncbi:MAG: tetraacyldisaccharide 4'-kinase [Sedimentisphaerales bacterium]|nr:tetraacyldisaccharide 4'-kinase [Sedimentisphaerales bacterium]